MIIADDHKKYETINIVLHGSFLHSIHRINDIQRHKVFSKTAMRCVLSPQYWKGSDKTKQNLLHSLALRGYGLDNGAYIDYNKGTEFNGDLFKVMCKDLGNGSDWIAIPDVVGDSVATLKQARYWFNELEKLDLDTNLLIVWQDGMTRSDLLPYIKDGYGVFVGGTTEGKLSAIPMVSSLCLEYGVWCHVGRVNTMRRVQYCKAHKVKSVDGSGFSRFLCSHKQFVKYMKFKEEQISLFSEKTLDFTDLKTFEQRLKVFGIDKSIYEHILTTNTDYIGLGKNEYKQNSSYLRWDR